MENKSIRRGNTTIEEVTGGEEIRLLHVIDLLGSGRFGMVYKVKDEKDKIFAVKRIQLNGQNISLFDRECEMLGRLHEKYVVKMLNKWSETTFMNQPPDIAYIKMEFCYMDLNSILKSKKDDFGRKGNDPLNLLEIFCSFELLRELTEGVNYLHSFVPPVMHRDIKPANVVITDGRNGIFLKLCDFGFSRFYDGSNILYTEDRGTDRFIAPEVVTKKYSTKADIFSLGVLATVIFDKIEGSVNSENYNEIRENVSNYMDTIRKMKYPNDPDVRPTAENALRIFQNNIISKGYIENQESYLQNREKITSPFFNSFYDSRKSTDLIQPSNISLLNNFNIFANMPSNIKDRIKLFFVSCSQLAYGMTNPKVYGLGEDISLLLNYKEEDNKFLLIKQLCDKRIEEFFEGNNCMFARTDKNEIFSWGWNGIGLLGKGYATQEYLEPSIIEYFTGKNIGQISCGTNHCLAISFDSSLYIWGNLNKENLVLIPINVNVSYLPTSKIERFFDGEYYSLDKNEKLYKLEENKFNFLLDFEIINKRISQMEEEIETDFNEYETHKNIIEIKDFFIRWPLLYLQTSKYIYVLNLKSDSIEKTFFGSFFEYFLNQYQTTYKTIAIIGNDIFVKDFKKNDVIDDSNQRYSLVSIKIEYTDSFPILSDLDKMKKFRILSGYSINFNSNIKCYYKSEKEPDSYFWFFVMVNNKVYSTGYNNCGKLGLGDKSIAYDFTLINELCDKNIEDFFEGKDCMFARNDKNEIFAWGINQYGLLSTMQYLKPTKIDYFNDKNIIDISCGYNHYIALSSSGIVYLWDNKDRKIENLKDDIKEFVTFITSDYNGSIIITKNGNSHYLDHNYSLKTELDTSFKITKMDILNAKKAHFYHKDQCFILDKNGKVFIFHLSKNKVEEIKIEIPIYDINITSKCIILQSDDFAYEFNDGVPIRTKYVNFYEYFTNKSSKTYKTIHIRAGYLYTREIKLSENEDILKIENKNCYQNKYEQEFIDIRKIGSGTFGTVIEVQNKFTKDVYAIKQMELKDELDLNEVKIMSNLKSEFVVKYIDSWVEETVYFRKIKKFFFIQMEFCSGNLRQFLEYKNKIYSKPHEIFQYFISYELFNELTECVNYLHSINIIHRDLKPENILISDGINGRFLKLCDFGLAKIHQMSNHTRMIGTMSYMAPEVLSSRRYNEKSDIYGLALIATELFQFEDSISKIRQNQTPEDFDIYLSRYLNTSLEKKFRQLLKTLIKCLLQKDYHSRPDCRQLLEKINEISVNKSIVLSDKNIQRFQSTLKENNLKKFFNSKIMSK